jgi:hypothetical protein
MQVGALQDAGSELFLLAYMQTVKSIGYYVTQIFTVATPHNDSFLY